MNLRIILITVAALLIVVGGGFFVWKAVQPKEQPINTATFACDEGKTITASFFKKSVSLILSDARKLSLPQAIAASGTRYANADGSFVFWSKGNTAFITEGKTEPQQQTFSNCVTGADLPGTPATASFASSTLGIKVDYPKNYQLNTSYAYDQFGAKKLIHGVKFIIPTSMATGTNLSSSDTGVSIEQLPNAKKCTGDIYLLANVKAAAVTEGGVDYSIATSSGAGAGNFYEEIVYALAGSKPCIAVRYFIHSTNINNYPAGAVVEFDRATILSQFDAIRQSLEVSVLTP